MVKVNNWWKNLLKTISKNNEERLKKVLKLGFWKVKKLITRRFTQVFIKFSQQKYTNNLFNLSLLKSGFPVFSHSLLLSLLNI